MTEPTEDVSWSAMQRCSELAAENARLREQSRDLVLVARRIVAWLDRLAAASDERAKDTRFITLAEANADDAKNYRATAAHVRRALAPFREEP